MKRAEKAAALGLFLAAIASTVALLASPSIYRILLAKERSIVALEQIEIASSVLSSEEELRQRLDQIETKLSGLPGFSRVKSSVLLAAEATQFGADIFAKNNARMVSSQVFDATGADEAGSVRIKLVGEAGHANLHEIIYDLEFGDAAFLIEEAVIRSGRAGAPSRRRQQSPSNLNSAGRISVEVLIRWLAGRQERTSP